MIKSAKTLILKCLNAVRRDAVTLPPWGIYVRPERMNDVALLQHEQVHWAQWQRMGTLRFYTTYLWQLWLHGYDNHPMEHEARKAEVA
jgi:hypothetical protein